MSVYDRYENELNGISLQDGKRIAREIHPIAPQLDVCRALVGQDKLPSLSSSTSPSTDVLAQTSILEQGLRYGGHIDSRVGIWNEMARLSSSSGDHSPYSLSKQRIFVSILIAPKNYLKQVPRYGHVNLFFYFQAKLVYKFQKILNYSVTAISTSEVYFLSFQCSLNSSEVYFSFCS